MNDSELELNSVPGLTETDKENLLAGEEHFTPHSWDDIKNIIAEGNLSILKRKPSDLVRYMKWTAEMKAQYGSITNYICKERLHWELLSSTDENAASSFAIQDPRPFAARSDYKVLRNDWPYGFELGITHLVVWLKTPIPVEQPDGHLTPDSHQLLSSFVDRYFYRSLLERGLIRENRVQWFKNWVSLQSVRNLDHFHVLVRDVPEDLLAQWTANSDNEEQRV